MNETPAPLPPADYPPLLAEIPQRPKKLYVRGTMPSYDLKWLSVVGSRAFSPYGRQACEQLIAGLAGSNVVIVSGLALGIDAIAHRAALNAGLKTVAIPGSGLDWDVLYPRSNVALGRAIVEADGAIISEFEHDLKANDWTFPKRNRIMAGIAHATLVIEAAAQSGTLITARLAADYNRDVLTVPGPIFSESSEGPNMLLRLGATPIRNSADILDALDLPTPSRDEPATLRTDMSPQEIKVLECIAHPISRDELIGALNIGATEANILLSAMEIKGLIKEEMGEVRRA